MATIESPTVSTQVMEVDRLHAAARVSIRPLDHESAEGIILGHYRAFGQTSAIAPNAGVVLGLARWTDTSRFAVITRVYTCLTVVTAVTAQRTDPLLLLPTRGYTVAETTNVTAVNIGGNNAKNRVNMGTALMSSVSVASNAAGMTGGTKTNDATPIGAVAFGPAAIAALGTGIAVQDLYRYDKLAEHPFVLSANEGLLLTWGTTTLATGTVTVGFGIDWAEVAAY